MQIYRELFDYVKEEYIHVLKINIGNFISHRLDWKKEGKLLTVEEVNSLDRIKIAEQFINYKTFDGKYEFLDMTMCIRDCEKHEICNDIAQFIDLKIPLHYWIRLIEDEKGNIDRSEIKNKYQGIDSLQGIKFWYQDNYLLEDFLIQDRKKAVLKYKK